MTIRDKETVRALADRDYWRRVGTLIGSTLYGYSARRSAGFSDPPVEITGTVGEVLLEQARKIERLRKRRFTVSVLPATVGEAKKYTVVCHGRDDAMLLAFALDGGWSAMEEIDASGMFALAEEYCVIISEEAAEEGGE